VRFADVGVRVGAAGDEDPEAQPHRDRRDRRAAGDPRREAIEQRPRRRPRLGSAIVQTERSDGRRHPDPKRLVGFAR
jgi:hypothetical protein